LIDKGSETSSGLLFLLTSVKYLVNLKNIYIQSLEYKITFIIELAVSPFKMKKKKDSP